MSQAPSSPPPPPPFQPSSPTEPPGPRGPRGPRAAYGALGKRGQVVFWVLASVLGLIFISLIAAAGGNSSRETVTVSEVRTQTERQSVTVTETRTVRAPAAPTRTPTPDPQPTPSAARTFEGNGSRNIGSITLDEDSTLRWTNSGDLIQIFVDDPFNVLLNSQGPSGETFVAAGSYNGITVNAIGDWTLSFE